MTKIAAAPRRASVQPDVHAIPWGTKHHTASRTCACGPKSYADLLQPSRQIWLHRKPEPGAKPLRGERLADRLDGSHHGDEHHNALRRIADDATTPRGGTGRSCRLGDGPDPMPPRRTHMKRPDIAEVPR